MKNSAVKDNSFSFPPMARNWRLSYGKALLAFSLTLLGGCATGLAPSGGPSTGQIARTGKSASSAIKVIDVDSATVSRIVESNQQRLFSDTLGQSLAIGSVVSPGDTLEVSIWEAPPAALFGASPIELRNTGATSTARPTTFPEQTVGLSGKISIPFAGMVQAAGRAPDAIATDIARRLAGKAHMPQVIVRIARNATLTATVMGEVGASTRLPLTAKGERLLDALAAAGGVRQPVGKMTIQITRGDIVASLPLDMIVRDPRQNIILKADDVVAALFQPYSFTVLGAAGRNDELPFESTGLTLSQALGRVGGLQDQRANPNGVFVFRFETPAALGLNPQDISPDNPSGRMPVVYRVNLQDPASFFLAQRFPLKDKDILYISNAPIADLQKFLNIVGSVIFPIISVQNAANN